MNLADFDPFDSAHLLDPYPMYRVLRDESPVHFVEKRNMWIVTRYADVVSAARNHAVFSSTGGVGYDWNQRPMMPMYDPPEHSRMRRLVAKPFTPQALNATKERVRQIVDDLLDQALEEGTVDLIDDIAIPVALGALSELLGLAAEHRPLLRKWSQGTVADLAGALHGADARRADELRREFNAFLRSLIHERRRQADANANDVISQLVMAEQNDKLVERELVAFCVLLLVAGYETTVNAMGNGLIALAANPGECAKVRKDPSLVQNLCEEIVRFDGPVQSFFRNTLGDVELGGVKIPKGSKVMLTFASANRDPRFFEDPDVLRIDREPKKLLEHVGYGAGIHYCLGAPLARMQLRALAEALVARTSSIELAGEPKRSGSVLFHGVVEMPIRLSPSGVARATPVPEKKATRLRMPPLALAEVTPFRIDVPDDVLTDLKARLDRARLPDQLVGAAWDYGTDRSFMEKLIAHWKTYDWRVHEKRLNALPQFRGKVGDQNLHFVHVKSGVKDALPLLMVHGWPGPFTEFTRLIEPLTKPAEGRRAFDLVIVSPPGYPFSDPPKTRGMGILRMAEHFDALMRGLGYARYGVVAEDWAASIATRLGLVHPDRVVAIHINMPADNPPRDKMKDLTPEEKAWLKDMGRYRDREMAYFGVHTTKPQTLAFGLTDSPVALAAWLVEKYRAWSDCDGDVERRFSLDDLLTNVMLYWCSGTGTAIRSYYELRQVPFFLGEGEIVPTPTGVLLTKKEIVQPPRRWMERMYNLQRLTHVPSGGHFSSWEEPQAVAEDIQGFFGPLA